VFGSSARKTLTLAEWTNSLWAVPYVRYTIQVDTEDVEPSRVITVIDGFIFDCDEDEQEVALGTLKAYLVMPDRVEAEGESLYDAMDSISDFLMECYEALFDPDLQDWSQSVQHLYTGGPIYSGALLIDEMELLPEHRGKGYGTQVVRETIETFGLGCGLVACKPYLSDDSRGKKSDEEKQSELNRIVAFWKRLDFVHLADTGFYVRSPELTKQPDPDEPRAPAPRVPRGRRRPGHHRSHW
jgi:hypothetical protein